MPSRYVDEMTREDLVEEIKSLVGVWRLRSSRGRRPDHSSARPSCAAA